ncbi:MAG: hypothetical protein IJ723_03035 [Ruminococcus sp.]|nr:hypothetical protein [Ruminococcus sp.]
MLLLDVPYEEKDEAKALGAQWKPEYKKWSVFFGKDYKKFDRWIPKDKGNIILCDYVYLIVGMHECFRCRKHTPVIGLGVEKFFVICDNADGSSIYKFNNDGIHICPFPSGMPNSITGYVAEKYNLRYDYSKTVRYSYLANHCSHCGIIQGDFYLFDEVDTPFFITEPSDVKKLSFYKYKLPYDVICDASISYGSEDYLLKEYADVKDLIL